jgi:hypothetical protein
MTKTLIAMDIYCLAFFMMVTFQANANWQVTLTASPRAADADSMPSLPDRPDSVWTVFGEDGSVRFSAETARLLTDAQYRAAKYPEVYDAIQVPDLLEAGDIPFALWTVINSYTIQPEQVKVIAYKLAAHGIRGTHYLNAFYTYAFADPEVMDFTDAGAPSLGHPERLEEKLWSCRTLAAYTDKVLEGRSGDQ